MEKKEEFEGNTPEEIFEILTNRRKDLLERLKFAKMTNAKATFRELATEFDIATLAEIGLNTVLEAQGRPPSPPEDSGCGGCKTPCG